MVRVLGLKKNYFYLQGTFCQVVEKLMSLYLENMRTNYSSWMQVSQCPWSFDRLMERYSGSRFTVLDIIKTSVAVGITHLSPLKF
jgi:hypothetical protein